MIEFSTQQVTHPLGTIEAACLVTNVANINNTPEVITRDGEELPLTSDLVLALSKAIIVSEELEADGFGVDCTVFGTLALGGSYQPVSEKVYRNDLYRQITYGRWLREEEVFGIAPHAQLIQFGRWDRRLLPVHTAVQLPGLPDTYIQKLGHELPIMITDAISNFQFHRANVAAIIDRVRARLGSKPVLEYWSSHPEHEPMGSYEGLPG